MFDSVRQGFKNARLKLSNKRSLTEEDIDGLSEKLVDGLIAWGNAETIEARLAEHAEAGATHVCIHPLHPEKGQGAVGQDALTALATN